MQRGESEKIMARASGLHMLVKDMLAVLFLIPQKFVLGLKMESCPLPNAFNFRDFGGNSLQRRCSMESDGLGDDDTIPRTRYKGGSITIEYCWPGPASHSQILIDFSLQDCLRSATYRNPDCGAAQLLKELFSRPL
jgi:hypothetical protein